MRIVTLGLVFLRQINDIIDNRLHFRESQQELSYFSGFLDRAGTQPLVGLSHVCKEQCYLKALVCHVLAAFIL